VLLNARNLVDVNRRLECEERRLGDLLQLGVARIDTRRNHLRHEGLARDHADEPAVVSHEHGAHRGIREPLPRFLRAGSDVERSGLRDHRIAHVLVHG
jgi:hypothetical protein